MRTTGLEDELINRFTNQEVEANATESSSSEIGALLQSSNPFSAGNTVALIDERSADAAQLHRAKDRALVHDAGELRPHRRFAAGSGRRCVVEEPREHFANPSLPTRSLECGESRGNHRANRGGGTHATNAGRESGTRLVHRYQAWPGRSARRGGTGARAAARVRRRPTPPRRWCLQNPKRGCIRADWLAEQIESFTSSTC